jgi:trans-2,3-dihydro-3-hydroxyanthranilate isomerase
MKSYPFMQVDAFTQHPLGGNPCAILFDTDDLSADTMLAIAREMNLSETAFVRRSKVADFGARFFTPAEEIPLAGHPTIATVFALVVSGRLKLQGEKTTIILELPAGPIPVEIYAAGGQVQQVIMNQLKPRFLKTFKPEEALPVFGLLASDLLPGCNPQVVSTGTPQLMIPLKDHEALRRAWPNIAAYRTLCEAGEFFSPHLFCLTGATEGGDTFARHFGAPPDTPEDPFTGSATGGMAAYLWRYGLIPWPRFNAEQGHWMGRPGLASVEVIGPPEAIETVRVGGGAVLVLEGTFSL